MGWEHRGIGTFYRETVVSASLPLLLVQTNTSEYTISNKMYRNIGGGFESLISDSSLSPSSTTSLNGERLPVIDLGRTWSFTYMMRGSKGHQAQEAGSLPSSYSAPSAPGALSSQYETAIHLIGDISNTEEFWGVYNHVKRARDLPVNTDCHVFRQGIKPVWEDPVNARGGKWMVRLRKGLASRLWEHLIIAIVGDQFELGDEICGAVLSIRSHEDILSIWNRSANDEAGKTRIRDVMRKVLMFPGHTVLEYKAHDQSMKDNSSFRNTDRVKL